MKYVYLFLFSMFVIYRGNYAIVSNKKPLKLIIFNLRNQCPFPPLVGQKPEDNPPKQLLVREPIAELHVPKEWS